MRLQSPVGAALDRLAFVRAALDRRLVFSDDAARRVPAEDIPFIPAVPDPHRRVLRLARKNTRIKDNITVLTTFISIFFF